MGSCPARTLITILGILALGCAPASSQVEISAPSSPSAALSIEPSPSGQTCRSVGGLPDPICTPGATNPDVTQDTIASTICVSGWTKTVRPPATYTNALKIDQMKAYGETDLTPSDVEEDHLIPLELGGAPRDPHNLWPEPRRTFIASGEAAEDKDLVENALKAAVCAGRLTLADAQQHIATDWETAR